MTTPKLINQAKNVTYIRYYDHLVEQYDNPKRSQELLELEFRNHLVEEFKNAANLDSDSKLGTYQEVNTNIVELQTHASFEPDRILITRYRTGSQPQNCNWSNVSTSYSPGRPSMFRWHRHPNIKTLSLLYCPLLVTLREKYEITR